MALPDWIAREYAGPFISAYGRQIFGQNWQPGSAGTPMGLPADVQQQVASFAPYQTQALEQVGGITPYAQNLANLTAGQVGTTAGGGYLGTGVPYALQNIGDYQTASTMAGAYLDPSSNPFLRGTFNAAAQPVINAYQTAIAPGLTAASQRAGQFGSTAANEQGQINQYNLGRNLDELAAGIYGGAYGQERGIQSGTINQNQQLTAQAFQNERQRQIQAATMGPQAIASLYQPANTLYGAGAQIQQQGQNVLDTDYANAVARYEAPFNELQGLGGAMLQAGGGGETTSKTQTKGGSLICNFLHSRHVIDDSTLEASEAYGRQVSKPIMIGYRRFARPLVRAMERSRMLTLLLKPFALAWSKEMKAQVGGGRGSLLGKAILKIGLPICERLGKREDVSRETFRRQIIVLQDMMKKMPGALTAADYETRHYFTPVDRKYGCCAYARAIFLPKGHIVIGKIHKHAHLNFILKGKTSVATEFGKKYFAAPCIFISEPGLKRAVFVEEDCVWVTVHLTEHTGEENLDLIENEVIAKSYAEFEENRA